jgi:hypothetical protein
MTLAHVGQEKNSKNAVDNGTRGQVPCPIIPIFFESFYADFLLLFVFSFALFLIFGTLLL